MAIIGRKLLRDAMAANKPSFTDPTHSYCGVKPMAPTGSV